jgi:site-specific DNA recombinase
MQSYCVSESPREAAAMTKTAALYARYSSDIQQDRSIDDQFALCCEYAKRNGYTIVTDYCDREKSSATLFDRDGLLRLMGDAKTGKFGTVIVECLDRVSRDQADLPTVFKRLKFRDIEIDTVNEGKVTETHIGLRGMFGAMFLKDLSDKVRRGYLGRVREGKVPGHVSYGYRAVPNMPNVREIDPEKAPIVRRIFEEYAAGVSPRLIALGLTRDDIAAPKGNGWSHQSFIGGGTNDGMLGNELYIGRLRWNRGRTVRNPETGRCTLRANPESDHLNVEVPHLRIIPQGLWDAAQAVRDARAVTRGATAGRKLTHRSSHLLAGLLLCGGCNGRMILTNKSRGVQFVACAAARNKSACSHRKAYDLNALQKLVMDGMDEDLVDPEVMERRAKARFAEYTRLMREEAGERDEIERELNRIQVRLQRITNTILDVGNSPTMSEALQAQEAKKAGLEVRLSQIKAAGNVVALHPSAVSEYRSNYRKVHDLLTRNPDDPEGRQGFRNMVNSIVVRPTDYRKPYSVSVYGRLSAMLGGVDLFPTRRSNEEILAEEGVSLPRYRQGHEVKCSVATLADKSGPTRERPFLAASEALRCSPEF